MKVTLHAVFASASAVAHARERVVRLGGVVQRLRSPVPQHPAADSPVRTWVLIGGLVGFSAGWVLTIGTALAWPLRVGGKPIVSLPAFFVIAFELTILFAALAGLAGFLRHARLPARPGPGYRDELAVDGFGLVVRCGAEAIAPVRAALEQLGAVVEEESG